MKKLKSSKLKEYSKRCIAAMIVLWFAVALFGIGVNIYQLKHTTTPEAVTIDPLYAYVGLPMTGGIIGYLIKSAMENKEKIKGLRLNQIGYANVVLMSILVMIIVAIICVFIFA